MNPGIERQIGHIQDKDHLHKFVDELPEGSCGLFIVQCGDEDTHYQFIEFGDITAAECLYATKAYEHNLF